MVVAQATRETTEVTEKQSLAMVKNLLRIALYNISYIRGLFPEKYYQDKYVPALEMKIKKLVPLDDESRRLIDWMEKGVYDALQQKYLKTMVFAICEDGGSSLLEEYTFSFTYGETSGECNIELKAGGKSCKNVQSGGEISAVQMKSAACKMVRTLSQLMRTLDSVPEKRTLLVKLFYYDDVTPKEYEPPFFRTCGQTDQLTWSETPLKMKVGDVNAKHYSLALKVRSVLDPCDNEEQQGSQSNTGGESESGSESESDDEGVEGSEDQHQQEKEQHSQRNSISQAETQDAAFEAQLVAEVKQWLDSRPSPVVDSVDFFAQFSDKSVSLIEGILNQLVRDGVLGRTSPDVYCILHKKEGSAKATESEVPPCSEAASTGAAVPASRLQVATMESSKGTELEDDGSLYHMALYHALQMDYVGPVSLQEKLGGGVSRADITRLIERMVHEGLVAKNPTPRQKGRKVLKKEKAIARLDEVKRLLKMDSAPDAEAGDGSGGHGAGEKKDSRAGCFMTTGSECTKSENPGTGKRTATQALEDNKQGEVEHKFLGRRADPDFSSTEGQKAHGNTLSQDPAVHSSQKLLKASMVLDPIHQAKKLRPEV